VRQQQSASLQSQDTLLYTLGDQLGKLAARSTALEKSERILESLYCEEVHRRELGISEAESRTFSWVFESWCLGHEFSCGCSCLQRYIVRPNGICVPHDKTTEPPCAGHERCQKHFLNWLDRDTNDPFMITGKPGSGKSTFMKFITGHEQTQSALDRWSGGRKLVVASFYFWSSGTPLQRSQDGLLRCLLYKILSQIPDMIPVAVPRRWQAADQFLIPEPWSRKEIFDAFANVISVNSTSTNFCFFIDGLDEYGGSDLDSGETDLDLVLQLRALSSSPFVKLCLSSRPRNVFQGHFPTNGPRHITLHDHTTKDIEQLVESRIGRVQGLVTIESAELVALKQLIVVRSSGVFLWVVLAVRELLDGLEPPFSMPELEERLLMLPATLEGYFQRILSGVHQQYRRFNARLLLLTVCRSQPLLCYAYALWLLELEEAGPRPHAANTTELPLLGLDAKSWETDTEARIKKVCGDFLIVRRWTVGGIMDHNHRSVRDFLELPAVREELLAIAGWQNESDVRLTLCQLFVSCCEAGVITTRHRDEFYWFTNEIAEYERRSGTTCADLIHRLDRLLCSRTLPSTKRGIRHWTRDLVKHCYPERAIREAQALLFYMAISGATTFVEQAIKSLPPEAQIGILNELLGAFLLGCCHPKSRKTQHSEGHKVVEFLCSMGADVNSVASAPFIPMLDGNAAVNTEFSRLEGAHKSWLDLGLDVANSTNEFDNRTIWEHYLQRSKFAGRHTVVESDEYDRLAVTLIEAGADLGCSLPEDCDNIQQAIGKRIEAEIEAKYLVRQDERRIRDWLYDEQYSAKLIRTALSKRGVAVQEGLLFYRRCGRRSRR
jgi:hypothetical protein